MCDGGARHWQDAAMVRAARSIGLMLAMSVLACERAKPEPAPAPAPVRPTTPPTATPSVDAAVPATSAAEFASAEEAYAATVSFFRQLDDVVKAGHGNCAKIGVGLRDLKADQALWHARIAASERNPKLKEAMNAYGKKVEDLMAPSGEALSKCASQPDVKTFLDGMK